MWSSREVTAVSADTLPLMWHRLMDAPDMTGMHCMVCKRFGILNNHHAVPRSAGELFDCGRKRKKPLITLCGSGNTSGCHGKAHHGLLHFDFRDGDWFYLEVPEPVDRLTALDMDGWVRLDPDSEWDWDLDLRTRAAEW